MNKIESYFYKLAGVRKESENTKWYSIAAFSLIAKVDQLLHHPSYGGDPFPENGPGLIIGNHPQPIGFIRGFRLCEINHRMATPFIKHTLLDYRQSEPAEIRQQTGKKQDLLNVTTESPWWHRKIADLLSACFKGLRAMPIVRGGTEADMMDFLDRGQAELKKKHLVGIFAQQTRSTNLADPKPGPAILAMENSEVPIYAVAIGNKQISLRRLGSYEELWDDPKTHDLAQTNLTVLIFDAIADQLRESRDPSDIAMGDDWYQNQRPKLLPNGLETRPLQAALTR